METRSCEGAVCPSSRFNESFSVSVFFDGTRYITITTTVHTFPDPMAVASTTAAENTTTRFLTICLFILVHQMENTTSVATITCKLDKIRLLDLPERTTRRVMSKRRTSCPRGMGPNPRSRSRSRSSGTRKTKHCQKNMDGYFWTLLHKDWTVRFYDCCWSTGRTNSGNDFGNVQRYIWNPTIRRRCCNHLHVRRTTLQATTTWTISSSGYFFDPCYPRM
mmetsp:Transcript_25128/g.59714  ORF Transcript_25128/g.59714 Transcript_25128/m.59714 type:complete len:220 (-) Transcript_25128:2032-2691(-)